MLLRGERDVATLGSRPINQADVFVRLRDAMNVEKPRGDECACARLRGGRTLAQQLDFQPAFLARLAQRRLLRVFVQFNVPAQRQPFVQLAVVNQQNLTVVDDKDGDGEINLLVNVSHGRSLNEV